MTITTDFDIDKDTRVIDYIGAFHGLTGAGYYSGITFHRHLGDLSDDASATPDDFMSIVFQVPSDRQGTDFIIQMQNGYTITQEAAEHLYDCSIIQNDGDDIWDGITCISATGTDFELRIMQNGANISALLTEGNSFWNNTPFGTSNPGLNPDPTNGVSTRFLLKVRTGGADIDGKRIIGHTRVFGRTFSEFKINGTERGKNPIPLTFANDLNNETAIGSMTSSPYSTVAYVTEGYVGIDVDNDTVDENYIEEWTLGSATSPQAYERWKYITRSGETTITLKGIDGEEYRGITHEVAVNNILTGPSNAFEPATWSGGTGVMLGTDSVSAPTRIFIQLLTGVAPSGTQTITLTTSSTTVDCNTTVEERTIAGAAPFCGVSTGSAIIGSYGLGVTATDLLNTDKVFDLDDGGPLSPPTYATFSINGLDTSGDVVLLAPRGWHLAYDAEASGPFTDYETLTFDTGGTPYTAKLCELIDLGSVGYMTIGPTSNGLAPTDDHTINGATADAVVNGTPKAAPDLGQYTLNGTLNGVTTTVTVSETIDSDMPATGTVRLQRADGIYTKHPYSLISGSDFTITSHDFTSNNATTGHNVFVSWIDKAAAADPEDVTVIYSADRPMFIRVRDGGGTPKKQAETTGTLGAAGGSVNVSLQSDE